MAEALPLADDQFDAVLAVLSDHLWVDRRQGVRELRRVARRRVVLFNADPTAAGRFWLTRDYLPSVLRLIPRRFHQPGVWVEDYLTRELGSVRLVPVLIPHDCRDGFYGAFWRRPAAYLRPEVRAGISLFARLPPREVAQALDKLRKDLASGVWQAQHTELREKQELDLGYYLIIAELTGLRDRTMTSHRASYPRSDTVGSPLPAARTGPLGRPLIGRRGRPVSLVGGARRGERVSVREPSPRTLNRWVET